jgi:hypothetical protein
MPMLAQRFCTNLNNRNNNDRPLLALGAGQAG